jgi:hypothetical protein
MGMEWGTMEWMEWGDDGMGDGLIRAISSIFNAKSITQIRPSLFPRSLFPEIVLAGINVASRHCH